MDVALLNMSPYEVAIQIRNWLAICTPLWYVFKGYNWVKDIKTNHLTHIQKSVENLETKVEAQTKELAIKVDTQTKEVVNELKELRTDIKTFTTAFIAPPIYAQPLPIARVARAKKK